MRCAWSEFISILPHRIRSDVDRLGKDTLQELRLRLDKPPLLVGADKTVLLDKLVSVEDISFVVNTASRYSPWSATSAAKGYITAAGGHRIGICGEVVLKEGHVCGVKNVSGLCIRVARDFPGIAKKAAEISGNILILGPPGSGKTTLLRDLIRQKSDAGEGPVAVIDEREELFPKGIPTGKNTDVLYGCGKVQGVQMMLRTMGPRIITVDEITANEDCLALTEAGWCGVNVIATAHAADLTDLQNRPVYKPLLTCGLFRHFLILRPDKSWYTERVRA